MRALPPTNVIQLGSASFECLVAGTGRPSVVLINGSGGPIDGWYTLFGSLFEVSTTFAYNRPGLGGSTKPTRPQTASAMVGICAHCCWRLACPHRGCSWAIHSAALWPTCSRGSIQARSTVS
jgi:pimeloyl-ACP methyl ester carboxylesterase